MCQTRTKRRAISRTLIALIGAVILIVIVLGSAFELGLLNNPGKGSPFDAQPLLSHSLLGWYLNHAGSASPVGIASYGLYNSSGSIRSYSIDTSEVVGQANISALSSTTAWNDSILPSYNFLRCDQCALLQMNVHVLVKTTKGNQSFWVQDIASFLDTKSQHTGGILGLIYNDTTPDANITADSSGTGSVGTVFTSPPVTCYCFGHLDILTGQYSLPLDITLKILVQVPRNYSGIEITLLGTPFGSVGPQQNPPTNDTAFLPISGVISAYIEVNPYATISRAPYVAANYDAELVWTGYCCGQTTNFLGMNSNLSLSYLNPKGQTVSFPSFYTFGETGESATNLSVSPTQGGFHVAIGENNNTFLGD